MATSDLENVISSSTKLSARTKSLYLSGIREFVEYAGTGKKNWTSDNVIAWRDKLKRTGMKPQSINVKLNALRYASKRIAEKADDARLDFARDAELLKPAPPERPEPLTVDQARALVAACDGGKPIDIRDKAIAVLALRTGMRRASMCALKLSSLDGRKLTVPPAVKNGKPTEIILDDETMTALTAWIDVLKNNGEKTGSLFRSLWRSTQEGETTIGESLTADGLYRALKARAKVANIDSFYPNMLRYTFIYMAVMAGVPAHRIREMTGQKTDQILALFSSSTTSSSDPVASALPAFEAEEPVA